MKKLISILLSCVMLVSAFSLGIYADDRVPAQDGFKTFYVSSTGNDANDGSKNSPKLTFDGAYSAIAELNETKKTNAEIVLLDDVKAYSESSKTTNTVRKFLDVIDNTPTVTVRGVLQSDNTYSNLDFSDYGTVVFTLGTDMIFYDVNIALSTNGKNFYLCAGCFDLTFGFNFNNEDLISGYVDVVGTRWGDGGDTGYIVEGRGATSSKGPTINVYSGIYRDIYVSNKSASVDIAATATSTLNFYGGQVTNLIANFTANSASHEAVVMNLYCGTATYNNVGDRASTTQSTTVNIYNGELTKAVNPGTNSTVNKNLTAAVPLPEYMAGYCGVQDTLTTGTPATGKYDIRFVGKLNSLDYDAVGFEITSGGGVDYSTSCSEVYTTLLGNANGVNYKYDASSLGASYLYAVTISGIPADANASFTLRAFVKIGDTVYYGTQYTVSYANGAYASTVTQ